MRIHLATGVQVLACVLLSGAFAGAASAQGAYRYAIVAGPAQSIDGFSPGSLNEAGEVVYADNANGLIATSTETLAQVGDMIDGELLGAVPAGSWTSINDNGLATFRARYGAGNFDAIFTPTSVVAKAWDDQIGIKLGFVGPPSINNSGNIVYQATLCSDVSCYASAIFENHIELLRSPLSDGFVELTSFSRPMISNAGVIALYGGAYLADVSGAYLLPNNGPLARIVHTGESVGPGLILDNPGGLLRGVDLNESFDVVTTWNTESGEWLVLKNDVVVAQAGDLIAGIMLTEVQNHRPAINDAGSVAFIARHAEGFGVFTETDAVLLEGQQIGSEIVRYLIAVAINDAGVVAAHVNFESNFDAIVLATPDATNHYVEMTTGSSVALQQSVDVPGDAFTMRVDHRFATNSGQLNVRLDGVLLGSVGAPAAVVDEFDRTTFGVSGALLGQTGVTLELELDGPTGSTLEVDNVSFPGLVNGTFESGGIAGWQEVSSGAGTVVIVPEPSATLASLACMVALALLRRRAPLRGPSAV